MNTRSPLVYVFSDFEFDAERLALYYRGELVKGVDRKSLEVLAALLREPDRVVRHDDIIEQVWRDNPHGATPARVNQYVSKLQKVFSNYEPERKFIENLKGRGYTFTAEVSHPETPPLAAVAESTVQTENDKQQANPADATQLSLKRSPEALRYTVGGVGLMCLILIVAFVLYPQNNEEEVRRVVKDSQLFETLVLYKDPSSFKEEDLDKYWTAELDLKSNYDRGTIRTSVEKLINDGRRYGDETECEQFEFQSVEINVNEDMAVVKTLEKWFIAEYRTDGSLIKNKNVGPYFVSYILRNVDGRWLIEKSNTARANLPTPILTSIEATSDILAGQQFFVRLAGDDFLNEVVHIKVVGEGCPDFDPCTVPNRALREHSKISATAIENVPLTLASGEFSVMVQNGDSKPSNPVKLIVP